MRYLIRSCIASCLVCGLSCWTTAQDTSSVDEPPSFPVNEDVEPELGAVHRASHLIGCKTVDASGKAVGRVADVALDLDSGRLALLLVAPPLSGAMHLLALPAEGVQPGVMTLAVPSASDAIENSPRYRLMAGPETLTRDWAAKSYEHFGREPLWAIDDADDRRLTLASTLFDLPVTDSSGKELGRIEDLALVLDQAAVGYVALRMNGQPRGKMFPVPLSAVVIDPETGNWVLELPKGVLANAPSFDANQWPERIERGWVEYVHVRYGASPFSGVRRVPHSDQQDPAETQR